MTSPERPASALEADTLALAETAEAEAAAAEAEAHAAAARARAIRLRREANAAPTDDADDADDGDDATEPPDPDGDDEAVEAAVADAVRPRRVRLSGRKIAAVAAGIVVILVALAASGYMIWQDRIASAQKQRTAEFAAAARQDVMDLMSLDPKKTQDDLQRIRDNSTGNFKNSFPAVAEQLTKGIEQSKVSTTVTVTDAAVESMTDNSAIVLVAAATEAKVPDGAPQPRSWHLAVGLRMDGGKPKMANIEFVQ
jgi:Mce-associated membrane protein